MKKIIGLLLLLCLTGCGTQTKKIIDLNYNQDLANYVTYDDTSAAVLVANKVMPSTVELTVDFAYQYASFNPFSGTKVQSYSGTSQGTGFFINEDGYMITNAHVVRLTEYESYSSFEYDSIDIKANFADSNVEIAMETIYYDVDLDLAILKTKDDVNNIVPVCFYNLTDSTSDDYDDDSIKLMYGETTIAVGNANGYGISITQGVVSAPVRLFDNGDGTYTQAIQTDAAINPGNSGGPLCNRYGLVIGINSFKIVSSDSENLGYAIPSNVIMDYIEDCSKTINYYYSDVRNVKDTDIISRY